MRVLRMWICYLVCGLCMESPAQSAQQAASLPDDALAHLVLGEIGSTIIRIDRPQWRPSCGGPICPSLSLEELKRRGPAPLTEGITFYQRPVPTQGGTQWTGLCTSIGIYVEYDEGGKPGSITLHRRYGLSDAARGINIVSAPNKRGDWTAEKKACSSTTAIEKFFYAEDGNDQTAFDAALASRLFSRAVASSGPMPFHYECTIYGKTCDAANSPSYVAQHFAVPNIRNVEHVPCERLPRRSADSANKNICYRVSLGNSGESVTIELTSSDTNASLVRFEYGRWPVVY